MYIDNQFALSVSIDTISKNNLYEGRAITKTALEKIYKTEIYNKLLQKVLKYLDIRPRSEKEIRNYLKKKIDVIKNHNLDPVLLQDILDQIITRLSDLNFIDDKKFCRELVLAKIKRNKYSYREIELRLIQSGLDKNIYLDILNNLYTKKTEKIILKNLIKKRKYKSKDKLINYLLTKGFNYKTVKELL